MKELPRLYFATSGIRGKANTVISPELGLRVGRAVAYWLEQKEFRNKIVYVGYDTRRNSYTIASTIVAGLSSSGVNAKIFSKAVPTPLVIYATANSDAKAGLMVTGSHLPRDENGIILFNRYGNYYKGILEESEKSPVNWSDLGKIENTLVELDNYKSFLASVAKKEGLKQTNWDILVDPVHGPMKEYLEYALSPYVHNLIKFNWESDDTFSGRLSEPTPKNLEKTSRALVVSKCDLGIATDMDGDRVIFLTNKGKIISGDYVGAILAKKYWNDFPDFPIVVPINTSAIIEYVADKENGEIIYCDVGPPAIIDAMKKENAKFAFEETGKYLFQEYGIWPDAAITSIILFSYLQEEETTLSELVEEMPKLFSLKTKVPVSREFSGEIVEELVDIVEDEFSNIASINDMDGIRINFEDKSWLLLRPSGTEDCVRIFSEHRDEIKNQELNKRGMKVVENIVRKLT